MSGLSHLARARLEHRKRNFEQEPDQGNVDEQEKVVFKIPRIPRKMVDPNTSGDSIVLEVDEDLAKEFEIDEEEQEEEEKEVNENSKKKKGYFNARIKDSPNTAKSAIHKR